MTYVVFRGPPNSDTRNMNTVPKYAVERARRIRLKSLVLPREHGAWGILLIPLFSGAAVGLSHRWNPGPVLLLLMAVIALFWLHTPLDSLTGWGVMRASTPAERRFVAGWIAPITCLAALAVLGLLWDGRNLLLLPLACVSGILFLVQRAVHRLGKRARTMAQLIGALGLTATAAAAFYVVTGDIDRRAVILWIANWLFTAVQIQFVRLRIQAVKLNAGLERISAGARLLFSELVLVAFLLFFWSRGMVPSLVLVAYLPLLLRSAAWLFRRPEPLRLSRLGFIEMAHALVFGALLAIAFAG